MPTLAAPARLAPHVVGVVTQPDRPRGRGQQVSDAPVKALAVERGLPVLQPERLTRELFADAVRAHSTPTSASSRPTARSCREWLLDAPRLGMINVHASLLPKYRGAAPVQRAVVNGERETGVTIMRVVKALDAGPMLARRARRIGLNDTSDVVERDLATLGADLLVGDARRSGRRHGDRRSPQDDAAATYAPRLTKEEGRLDFRLPALTFTTAFAGCGRGRRPTRS